MAEISRTKISKIELVLFPLFVGLVSAFLSLILSVSFGISLQSGENDQNVFALVLIVAFEEIIKFFSLKYLVGIYYESLQKKNFFFFPSLFVGTGFGIFEISLLYLKYSFVPLQSLLLMVVHSVSTLLIGFGLCYHKEKKNKFLLWITFLLATIFHLCYNLIVINYS